jgi:hypothetical protein
LDDHRWRPAWASSFRDPFSKTTTTTRNSQNKMAPAVECLLCKRKAHISNPNTTKKKKKDISKFQDMLKNENKKY